MATHTAPLTDAAWTAKDALLTDTIANEVYASHYSERRLSRFVIGALSFTLLGSFAAIVSLAHKPTQNRYIRIDEMGRAQAIQYSATSTTARARAKYEPTSPIGPTIATPSAETRLRRSTRSTTTFCPSSLPRR